MSPIQLLSLSQGWGPSIEDPTQATTVFWWCGAGGKRDARPKVKKKSIYRDPFRCSQTYGSQEHMVGIIDCIMVWCWIFVLHFLETVFR